MSKIILLVIAFAAALWLVRGLRRRSETDSGDRAEKPATPGAEDMVRCAQCGVHLPRAESFMTGKEFFCSVQHQHEFRQPR
jgi:uncharacterized protein